ncbi:MAG: hypothetical protein ACP5VN_07775 [Acidobacteriota bacterium]
MRFDKALLQELMRFRPAMPPVAALLEPPRLVGLRVAKARKDPTPLVVHEEPLPPGGGTYLPAGEALERPVASLLAHLGQPKEIAVVVGDPFFRVQVLRLTDFPRNEEERTQVLLWQLRKLLNAPLDRVRLRYEVLERSTQGAVVLAAVCPEEEAAAVESAFGQQGCRVGFLGPSTFALHALWEAGGRFGEEAVLLLNHPEGYLSFLFLEGGRPVFFRCKDLQAFEAPEDGGGGRAAQELRLTLAYYREKLGGTEAPPILVRTSSGGHAFPFHGAVEEGAALQSLAGVLPPLPTGAPRDEAALPLFGVLEGCP